MEIERHNGMEFIVINSKEYVLKHIDNCLIGSKVSNVTAVQGRVGQKVKTIMKDGFAETYNIVSYDSSTGEPDWIVTQESGENMVVSDAKYKSLYEIGDIKPGEKIKPNGKYRAMIRIDENVALKTSWGEVQYIKKGGVLVVLEQNDIYGIQKEEFENSYKIIEEKTELAKNMLNENINKVEAKKNMPTIFLSVAYPYDNEENQQTLKNVIRYVNSKGVRAINIRKIHEEENVNLVKEITKALSDCEGILSLAFNKGGYRTSPFIQIEGALAASLNLDSLMLVPDEVQREGLLFEDNLDGNVVSMSNEEEQNKKMYEEIDKFIEKVLIRNKNKISEKDFAKFKQGLFNPDTKEEQKKNIVNFLKNFYSVKQGFDFDNVYIKKNTKIKATVINEDGLYETKNGKTFLMKGDYLVTDIDGRVYNVEKKEFEERYIKVNGEEDCYVTKLIPTIARKKDGKVEVYALSNEDDKYSMEKEVFSTKYQTLEEYILLLYTENESRNIQEL